MYNQKKFFDEFRGFIGFFLIFGLWPCWRWQNSKYKCCLIIYSIGLICFIGCIFFFAIFMNIELSSHALSSIVEYSFLWSVLFTHLVILLEVLINRNAQMRLIQKITYADFLFKHRLQLVICYRDEKRAIFKRFAVLIFISISVRAILTVHLYYQNRINNIWYECMCSVWILRLRFLQIIFFVFFLRNRLNLLKEKLKEMLVSQSFYADNSNRWRFFRDASKVFVLDSSIVKRSSYNLLLNLKQIYGELYEISELISLTFGWSLLAIVAQNFIEFIGNSYWIFLSLGKSKIDLEHLADSISLLIPITVMLGTMVYYCSSCSRYVSFSSGIILKKDHI